MAKKKWLIWSLATGSGVIGVIVFFLINSSLVVKDIRVKVEEDNYVAINLGQKGLHAKKYKYIIEKNPSFGELIGKPPRLVYKPQSDFSGKDRFMFTVSSYFFSSNIAAVNIDVLPQNDPPVALPQKLETLEDISLAIELEATDKDNTTHFFSFVTQPLHGKIRGKPPHIQYLPQPNFFGKDSFSFLAKDFSLSSRPAQIEITIQPVNDLPVAFDQKIKTFSNTPVAIRLTSTDVERQIVSFFLVNKTQHGTLKGSEDRFIYHPNKNFTGKDDFLFRTYDGFAYSNTARVEIQVKHSSSFDNLRQVLSKQIKVGGVAIGNSASPDFVYEVDKYIPASIIKIATAAASLHILKEDYHFKTEIYRDKERNLYLKGFGDPSLSTQEWNNIARKLARKKIFKNPLNDLVLDDSAFVDHLDFDGRGLSIYYFDAPLGALSTNFNTARVKIMAKGQVIFQDKKTPVTQTVIRRTRGLPKGPQFINIAQNSQDSTNYSGELAYEIFKKYGAFFKGKIRRAKIPKQNNLLLIHRSKATLSQIVKKMLKDSNNFIANQLLMVMALHKFGEKASLKQGVSILNDFLQKRVGLAADNYALVEGSGMSRQNRIDLLAMLKLVNYFEKYKNFLPLLSLSKYRDLARVGRKWRIRAKTGTLKNVSTIAGYLQLRNKKWKPFVIMLGQDWKDRGKVLDIIARYYHTHYGLDS